MRIHLVSYATAKYRHRQIFLSTSAKANGVVSHVSSWNAKSVEASEFSKIAPDISLTERGSGFWAWKPFIIQQALESIPDGDLVFYCDVGRKYPYILLEHSMDSFVTWMNQHQQDIMPGITIPWNGAMSAWTKREALVGTGMDHPKVRSASPIQASFSLWRAGESSRSFVSEWLSWCVQRKLVSDDPAIDGSPEAQEFRGHRHDQSLLTLCCLKHGIQAIDLGPEAPTYNERDPGQVAANLFGTQASPKPLGQLVGLLAKPVQAVEQILRERITFGKNYE